MGAWGVLAFDNDTACDWAYELEGAEDLAPVIATFQAVDTVGDEYLDQDLACQALAACEVLARLRFQPGYTNAYTEPVDAWVKAHPIAPPAALIDWAPAILDRVLGKNSELSELWEGAEATKWQQAVEDLRSRLAKS